MIFLRCRIMLPVIVALSLQSVLTKQMFAQKSASNAEITDLSLQVVIPIKFQINAKAQHLFIPSCGKDPSGVDALCVFGAVFVERFDGEKWLRIKPGYPGEVFGVDVENKNYIHVAPGSHSEVIFYLNRDFYHAHRGDKLRLEVEFWDEQEAMNKGKAAGRILSPIFACP